MNQNSRHGVPSTRDGGTGEISRRRTALGRPALVCLVYFVGFLALDFATEGIKGSLSVSLWFPPVGLTFALLLVFGWRYAAVVAPVFLLHLALFRGGLGYPVALLLAVPVLYAALYAGAAALLLRVVKIDPRLLRMRDVAWFVGVGCLLAPALVAGLVVSGFVAGGYASAGSFWGDLLGFWAGDATGIAVLTPLLLIALRPFPSLWAEPPGRASGPAADGAADAGGVAGFRLPPPRELPEAFLQVLVLALALMAAYAAARGASLDYVYLAFAPVVWVALRGGLERAVLALLLANVGVVVLVGGAARGADPALLQFGLMALTLVGLLLGGQTDEQRRAERTLRGSERRFRVVLQNSSEVFKICDPDGTLRYASPAYQKVFGYDPEEAVGTNVLDLVHPEDLPRVLEETERAMNETGVGKSTSEYRFRHADGSWRWVESVGTYLVDDPAVGGVVINVRDIAKRKEAEKTLRESEERFRALVQNSSDVITILDADGVIQYESPSIYRILGYRPEELAGESVFDYVHAEDRERALAALLGLVKSGGDLLDPVGCRFLHADGSWRYLEVVGNNLLDDPAVGGVVVNSRDTTESKEAEEALEESEARYRALTEQSVETIYVYDAETKRVLESNEAFREMIGYAEEELLGMQIYDFIAHDREDIDRRVRRTLREKRRRIGERDYRKKDGSIVVVETSASVVPFGDKTAICAVSRDVTELKAARQKLEESERRFRSMIQNAPDAISVLDADSTIRYDSPAIERVLGYGPEERVGKEGLDYVHPEDVELARRTLAEVLENPGVRLPVEYRLRHKDGSWRHFEAARTNLLHDPAVGGIVLNYRDVTERKRVEEKLREGEKSQRRKARELSLLHEVRSALSRELDPGDVCRAVVETVAGAYGYVLISAYLLEDEAGELVLQHQVGYGTVIERIPVGRGVSGRAVRDGRAVLIEDVSGEPAFLGAIEGIVSEVCVPLFDEGEAVGFLNVESTGGNRLTGDDLGLLEAVGEHASVALGRARLHARVKEAEERFRTAFENASAGVALVGLDRRYLRANRALCEMLGYPEHELLEKRSEEITHPDDQEISRERTQRMLGGGAEATSLEKRYLRKDGGILWAISDVSLVRDRGGRPSHFVSHFQNITERKKVEEALKSSEERYRAVVEQTTEAIWLFGPDTKRVLDSNAAFRQLLGYTEEELTGMTNYDFVAHSDESVDRVVARKAGDEKSVPEERKYRRKDGTLVDVEVDGTLISYRGEEAVCSVARDLTERKRAERTLRENESRLRAVTEGAPVILFALDADGVLTLSEGKGMRSLGLRAGEGVGLSVFEAYRGLPEILENVRRALAGEEVAAQVGIGARAYEARYSPVKNEAGAVVGVIGVATDVTERRDLEEELERQALHDPLTGLANRRLLVRRLARALEHRASRVALLFLDLDNFKVVNDSLGHEAGDRLLVAAGERLGGVVRPSDLVSRLGGDEFVVLLEGAGPDKAFRVAQRISAALSAPFALGGREVRASASVGIALGGAGRDTGPGELLREADVAMYRAKRSGKGSHAVFDPEADARAFKRLELENALRRALERGEFSLRYQPVVSVAGGEVIGFETLLRWEHPEKDVLAPAEFLAAAEEAGLGADLDGVALAGACRFQAALGQDGGAGTTPPWVSVNVSPRRLREPGFARAVAGKLRETGADPARLVVEVTEDTVVEGGGEAEATLRELKDLGTKLALDDFGTGYSSLSHLERLPADLLKLDRAFVENLGSSAKKHAVVRAVVDLAHATGMAVVAEGIETDRQLGALRRAGCDHAQGHLFAKPLVAEEAASLS